jgi:hypothetical protein
MVWPYFFAKVVILSDFWWFGQEKNDYPTKKSLIWVWRQKSPGQGDTG